MTLPDSSWRTLYSARGVPYQVWKPMPWIDPDVLDCTVYLYPSEAAAEDGERLGGTGCLVGVPVVAKNRDVSNVSCLVTNKHVVDAGHTIVRVNTHDGGRDVVALDNAKWYFHPDGDDLAICPIRLDRKIHKAKFVSVRNFLSKYQIETFGIGPGDDVFVVGRFVNHEGRQRNLPSVRFGNIAQMPWEPIVIDGFAQESFLVEARSISGYSGAPVFVFVNPQLDGTINPDIKKMIREGNLQLANVSPKRADLPLPLGPWLIGINYCYIKTEEPVINRSTHSPANEDWFVRSNTGMMGVIPVWKISDILDGTDMKPIFDNARRKAEIAADKDSGIQLTAANVPDAAPPANDANPNHREDFTHLVGAAARKQPQDD